MMDLSLNTPSEGHNMGRRQENIKGDHTALNENFNRGFEHSMHGLDSITLIPCHCKNGDV